MKDKNKIGKLNYNPVFIKTVDGNEFKLPKVSWKQEKQTLSIIAEIAGVFPDLGFEKYDMKNLKISDAMEMLPILLRKTPDHVGRLVSVLIDEDVEWVEENLDIEGVLAIVSPFFFRIYKMYEKHISKSQIEAFQGEVRNTVKQYRKKNT